MRKRSQREMFASQTKTRSKISFCPERLYESLRAERDRSIIGIADDMVQTSVSESEILQRKCQGKLCFR